LSVADPEFDAERERVFALYREQRLAEGLALVEEVAARHPDRPAETSFWRACFLTLSGRADHALEALGAALGRGVWWQRGWLDFDPDLEALRPLPAFAEIVAGSEANLAEAARSFPERPDVRLHVPESPARALLLVMPMYGDTAQVTEPHWLLDAELRVAVAVVGSSQSTPDGAPCWEIADLVVRDLSIARDEAIGAGIPEGVPLVLGGASQGGRRAIELAIDGRVPAAGFVAVVSGVPQPETVAPHLDAARRRGVWGWILTGELDPAAEAAERFGRELAEAFLEIRVDRLLGLGHVYPEDLPERLAGGLDLFLGPED
jgi:hypothetical protein